MRRAVVIGAATFSDSNFTPLNYAVADAQRFGEVLGAPDYGFFDDIQFLPNPTLPAARRSLEKLARHAAADDLILFYYSGHGRLDHDGSLLLILPETDIELPGTSAINGNELKQLFNSSRAAQKIVILDCCYSGAIGPQEFFKGGAEDTVASLAHQTTGAFILTASTRFQPAFESTALGGGTLTSCLIQGIETGDAAPQGSRHVTLGNLAAYARDNVPRHGAQQPQYWDLGSTGDVIMAYRKRLADLAWRKRVDAMLSRHFAKDSLDGDIIDDARRHLSQRRLHRAGRASVAAGPPAGSQDRRRPLRPPMAGPGRRGVLAPAEERAAPGRATRGARAAESSRTAAARAREAGQGRRDSPGGDDPAARKGRDDREDFTFRASGNERLGREDEPGPAERARRREQDQGDERPRQPGDPVSALAQDPGGAAGFQPLVHHRLDPHGGRGHRLRRPEGDHGRRRYDYPAPAETTELAAQNDPAMAIEAARGFVGDWAPRASPARTSSASPWRTGCSTSPPARRTPPPRSSSRQPTAR